MANVSHMPTNKRLMAYLPASAPPSGPSDPDLIRFSFARDCVITHDRVFDRFAKEHEFAEAARGLGAEMKEKHTVIEKWPFKLKFLPHQPKAQEEFDRLLRGGLSSKERYVEWKKILVDDGDVD
ncbi:hypothetical protein diail_8456 [Diaporthe ilicicola]|nr:hypothetical protein diail_8456 [Diaporthe ilicicola]